MSAPRALLALLLLATPAAAQAQTVITGYATVIDGDSLRINGVEIRGDGFDAPEAKQTCQRADGQPYPCGLEATAALRALIGGRPVSCRPQGVDRYKRTLAACSVGSVDIGAWMVVNGHAIAYRHFSLRYTPQEDIARAAGRGIWQGRFQAPWEWRQMHKEGRR